MSGLIFRYKKFIFSSLFLLVLSTSVCQIQQSGRFEKVLKFSDEDFTVIPVKDDGIVLIREKNKYKSGNQFWEVVLLDTALQETGTVELAINRENRLIGFDHSFDFVHLLFLTKEFKGEMDLLSINLKNKDIIRHEIKPELNFRPTHFVKSGDNFVFGGYVNMESAVLLYTTSNKKIKVVPGFFQKNVELVELRSNRNQTFNTLLFDKTDVDNKKVIFRTFDSSGKQLLEDITPVDNSVVLQSGITSELEREDLIVMGTWGKVNSRQSSGFYALTINPFVDQTITQIYFGELNHYLDYLKPKKAEKIKAKTKDDLKKGKTPDFSNYVVPYKIIEYKKGFLLLTESYIPSNSLNQNTYYSPYSSDFYYTPFDRYYPSSRYYNPGYPQQSTTNDNNDLKNSSIVAFDSTGKVLWDESLKLIGTKLPYLEQFADASINNNYFFFLYKKESELTLKKVSLRDFEVTEETQKIALKNPADEIKNESDQMGFTRHWFGNVFYVWGKHSIRNKTNIDKQQEVFYINKVVVH